MRHHLLQKNEYIMGRACQLEIALESAPGSLALKVSAKYGMLPLNISVPLEGWEALQILDGLAEAIRHTEIKTVTRRRECNFCEIGETKQRA